MPITTKYVKAFYWTMTTLTTIGYGDITPQTPPQYIFVIVIELMGAALYGLIIGNIANLIANIDIAKTQFKERMKIINTFLKYRNIPIKMRKRINDYYTYLWESRRGYDESKILEDLPLPLKHSISLFLNKDIIEKVPLFEGASEDLKKEIIMNLEPVVFTPHDNIVTAGEVGNDMYFLSKGSVDVLSKDEKKHFATLREGQFFGEIALILRMPRTATIRSREFCDMYRLDKDTFDSIICKYPAFEHSIRQLAEERRKELELLKQEGQKQGNTKQEEESPLAEVAGVVLKIEGDLICLKWHPCPVALHYQVIRKTGVSKKWKYVVKKQTKAEFYDSKDQISTSAFYKVRAVYPQGVGPWSEAVVFKNL